MKVVITIFILIASLAYDTFAKTSSTPDIRTISILKYSLERFYSNNNNTCPKSWNEFKNSGFLSEELQLDLKMHLDAENRFYFTDVQISDAGELRKVYLLANQASAIGRNGNHILGRLLIFQNAKGEFQATVYHEDRLRKLFSDAGLNLNDYTFVSNSVETDKIPIKHLQVDLNNDSSDLSRIPKEYSLDGSKSKTSNNKYYITFLVIGLFILLIFFFIRKYQFK